jgi:hypothetical protein
MMDLFDTSASKNDAKARFFSLLQEKRLFICDHALPPQVEATADAHLQPKKIPMNWTSLHILKNQSRLYISGP